MKFSSKKGYTLLFAVIVSVLVLSIATFILSVSRKQAILSSSSRDSFYAFYAADSGLECALEHFSDISTQNPAASINCGAGGSITVTAGSNPSNSDTQGTATFYLLTGSGSSNNLYQSGIGSCAKVTLSYTGTPATYDKDGNKTADAAYDFTIESRGYNIGWRTPQNDCGLSGPRKVERALQYTVSS